MKFLVAFIAFALSVSAQALELSVPSKHYHIKTEKIAHITGLIAYPSFMSFSDEMLKTVDMPGDRVLIIDSPGGEVDAGYAILKILQIEKTNGGKLVCIVRGEASSMAFNIFSTCDIRVAQEKSTFLVHKVGTSFAPGMRITPKVMRRAATECEERDKPFAERNARLMHLTPKDYDYYADQESIWSSEALLKMGYLDLVIK